MEELFKKHQIVAVMRASSVEEAKEKALAVFEGGVRMIEITFTVPDADKVIREISFLKEKGAVVGAGTVTSVEQCKKAIESGAEFIVSPHLDEEISRFCREKGVFYMPGVMTPTELVRAMKLGHTILKLFPGEVLGPTFVKAMKGPFPNVKFVPTGGVNLDNVCEWFKAGVLAVGVGSALVKGTPDEVKEKARAFVEKIRGCTE
ncbi:bifunctional 4-hydroxy-2-oxoglutarate aldolase/2-dehydro-3-deoxy-phosphogluconate aldolase [Thermotoga neapolitana]|uniref:bifunctional 4-hydroxy-2-oxoglutarate aldolase/2-dehydro-3-deoxy-phosphogluconate aldolase n=1 Tax=Thermotoga neapolitana TaxID=2337 RepID=UPI0005012BAB|nr:bifunctional 4-hydroxy-2-oxoglutarate aldolase/2-dehydro-3-deoxy-phosphogluconate aldolase [Thermotoga neapolitana]KFZ22420.1 2-dehydro-3-deoxyphosphogluconate aldolase/4-hydroxy-2-oxoglutarate aldolase [Thermotoga neapolitana LA10]